MLDNGQGRQGRQGGRRLKVAVVGASMSTAPGHHQRFAVRAHLPALLALPGMFEVVATCTTTQATAQAAADHFGVPRAFDSVPRMLAELPDIDVVCVSVRPVAQHEVVMQALAAGKHVYCEHPFGVSLAQAREMATLARERRLCTVVGHEHHYEPAMLEMAARIRSGYIGEPLNFGITFFNSGMIAPQKNARPWLNQAEMGGPQAWRTGHSLERVIAALGDIEAVCADMKVISPHQHQPGREVITQTNNINLLLKTRSGAIGSMQVCLTAWFGTGWTFQVYGTRGMLMIREEGMERKSTVKGDPKAGHAVLYGACDQDSAPQPITPAAAHCTVQGLDPVSTTFPVAQTWHALGRAILGGEPCSPSFEDEVKIHRIWEAVARSAERRAWETLPQA